MNVSVYGAPGPRLRRGEKAVKMINLGRYPLRPHCCCRQKHGCDLGAKSGGFTVVEILILVVIISIAAMIAVPLMSSSAGMQIRSAANMISADLEYAKSLAITRGQNYSVVFDTINDSYQIQDQSGNVIPHPVKKGFDYIVDFRNDGRLSKVDITDADFNLMQTIIFDLFGSPDSGGYVRIQAGGMTATINVESVTGFISISE